MPRHKTPATCLVCVIKAALKGKSPREKRRLYKELSEAQTIDCPERAISIAHDCAVIQAVCDDKPNAEMPRF